MKIPFASQYGKEKHLGVGSDWPVNMYFTLNTVGQECLYGVPQKELVANVGASPTRGMHRYGDNIFVVSGNVLYSIDFAFNVTHRGELRTSSGFVSISDNGDFGNQLMITDGTIYGYTLDLSDPASTLQEISDPDFFGADQNIFLDGYTIVAIPNSGAFGISSLYDSRAWDALDYEFVDGDPDKIISLVRVGKQILFGGEYTSELYYNSGTQLFPFQKVGGAFIEYGNAARWSMIELGDMAYWLGVTRNGLVGVVRSAGGKPQAIMPPGLVTEITAMATVSDAYAWKYMHDGHAFYVITFPSGNKTFAFDATTERWHERRSYGLGRDRSCGYCFANGWHIVGDYENGNIYRLATGPYKENGQPIIRSARNPHIRSDGSRMFFPRLKINVTSGGAQEDPAVDANITLKWSDNGGNTWDSERLIPIGKMGEYGREVEARALGSTIKTRQFEITISDDMDIAIMDGEI